MEGSVVVSIAGQRRSVFEGIPTGVKARQRTTHVNKVGGWKESIDHHTPLHPTTCSNPIGRHHTSETFSPPTIFPPYIHHTGATGSLLDSWTLRMGPKVCPKMSVRNYHYSPCKTQKSVVLKIVWCLWSDDWGSSIPHQHITYNLVSTSSMTVSPFMVVHFSNWLCVYIFLHLQYLFTTGLELTVLLT